MEFRIFLKQALFQWPLLALLIVFQLLLGHISSVALSDNMPELGIAVIRESEEPLALRYETLLEEATGLDVVKASASMKHEDIFFQNNVQGLVVIPPWFEEYLAEGRDNAVLFYPAPGVTDPSVVVEFLSTAALLMRADVITDAALADLGIEDAAFGSSEYAARPILTLEYDGPTIQETPLATPPAFGVPALFLLLAFLHAIQIVPGRDSRRLMQRSMKSRLRVCLMALFSLMAVWICIVLVYGLWIFLYYKVFVPAPTMLSLIGIALYACTLGCVFAAVGIRPSGIWVLALWLLFNMTLGGGLWGSSITSPLMVPLLPVSSVVSFIGADAVTGMAAIYISFAVCLTGFCGIIYQQKIKKRKLRME